MVQIYYFVTEVQLYITLTIHNKQTCTICFFVKNWIKFQKYSIVDLKQFLAVDFIFLVTI